MRIHQAAAEARGLGQPALPDEVVAAAVVELLLELECHAPPWATVEIAGTIFDPADPAEVPDSLAYAMRFNECGKARRTGVDYVATLAAEVLVKRLGTSGFVVMRRRPMPARR